MDNVSSLSPPPLPSATPVLAWKVPSDSRVGVTYTVTKDLDWACDCPAGLRSQEYNGRCKHVKRLLPQLGVFCNVPSRAHSECDHPDCVCICHVFSVKAQTRPQPSQEALRRVAAYEP